MTPSLLHQEIRFLGSILISLMLSLGILSADAMAEESMSLNLDKAIQLGTAHNRKAKMRDNEADAAAYRRKQAMGRFLPKVSLSSRYSRVSHVEPGSLNLSTPSIAGSSGTANPVQLGEAVDNQYSLRLTVDQPLFVGFGLWNSYKAAQHVETIALQRARAERVDVKAAIQETYFNLLKAQQMYAANNQLVNALEQHLQNTKLLYSSGRATELDMARVHSRVAAAHVSSVQIRGAETSAHLALTTLIGIPSTTRLELEDIINSEVLESIASSENLVADALASRPDITIAKESASLAAFRTKNESAAFWPQISLRYGYNYERPNQRYFPVHDRFDSSWDISAILSWTIWDSGVTFYGMKAVQAEASAASLNMEEVQDAVRLDVEHRRQGYINSREKINATKQALESAKRSYDEAKILFEAGRAQSLDLLDAATEWTRAQSDLVQSIAEARIAWALVQKATGRD